MNSLQKNQIQGWHGERAALLDRACRSVQKRTSRGEKIFKVIRRVARKYNGRRFKSDPSRRLKLSEKTLWRVFAVWKRGGELPAAFRLNYQPRRSVLTAPILIRFINLASNQKFSSMKSAWEAFTARRGSFGRGQHSKKPLKVSYSEARRFLPAAKFRQLQQPTNAIDQAETNRGELRARFIAEIRERLPERPPRRRVKKELHWEI